MSNHLDALVAPTGFPMDTMQSAHTVEVVLYVYIYICTCSWHDGIRKCPSFMLCHLLILTCVMWLAQQALNLSFYVVACHNDRQVLNNYFEP